MYGHGYGADTDVSAGVGANVAQDQMWPLQALADLLLVLGR